MESPSISIEVSDEAIGATRNDSSDDPNMVHQPEPLSLSTGPDKAVCRIPRASASSDDEVEEIEDSVIYAAGVAPHRVARNDAGNKPNLAMNSLLNDKSEQHASKTVNYTAWGDNNSGLQIGQHANVINNFHGSSEFNRHQMKQSLFIGLRANSMSPAHDLALKYNQSRAPGQSISTISTAPKSYVPHAPVTLTELKVALIKVAVVCQSLDKAFAEYFRVTISKLDSTKERLRGIREKITMNQSIGYVGSLGEYCESITTSSKTDQGLPIQTYDTWPTGQDNLPYLQDALEVPYWNMMANHFIKSSHINSPFTYDMVLSVVKQKRGEIKFLLIQTKQKWGDALPEAIEKGIVHRLDVLDTVIAETPGSHENLLDTQVPILQASPDPLPVPTEPESTSLIAAISNKGEITDLEKVSLLSLFIVFIALTMVPFGMGFAGYWVAEPSEAVGSTSDPDFKWLIATTLLSIFGNIYVGVPLRKLTRGSTANILSQVFLLLSIVLGIFSVSIYPFWNKAWSSSMSFFCNFFAIGSMFISSNHTSEAASSASTKALKTKKTQ